MKIGVDYYPEQIDSRMWKSDAEEMAKIGVKAVRLGVSAWDAFEPRESEFYMKWFDEIVELFAHYKIEIIMCIPIDKPPTWFFEKYPESIRTSASWRRNRNGKHDHVCINSADYRRYALRLTENLIRRYGKNSYISAWQVMNTPEAYACCCENCAEGFRKWLMNKYENIEAVNSVFVGNAISGRYSEIKEIHPPAFYRRAWRNPAHTLEFLRFESESASEFLREITMTIKRECPSAKVTSNLDLDSDYPDIYKLYDFMDFASCKNYPSARTDSEGNAENSNAFRLDLMRGAKQKNFYVMEEISGAEDIMSPSLKPGMLQGYSLQAFAHGADTVIHSRWRSSCFGEDMFRQGIIDHDNIKGRRFNEFTELCQTASKLSAVTGTSIESEVAIMYSYDSDKAFEIQPPSENFSYMGQLRSFHDAFSHFGANVDVVSSKADLSRYKVVIVPSLYVHDNKASESIYRYVINGGTLIMTGRSGVKDEYNNCTSSVLPSAYRELIGADVTDYDAVGNDTATIKDFSGKTYECSQWCDILTLTTAKTYAEYDDGFNKCCPAVTMNRYCGGVAYYVGTVCEKSFYEDLVGNVMMQTGIPKLKDLPDGVEVTTRTNGRDEYIFFFNNSGRYVTIPLPKAMFSMIESKGKSELELRPFAMDIVRK